jgi:putative ABC transport system permease protein
MTRSQWLLTWLEEAGRDLRHTLRSLARNKAFAAIVVMTLALGIGANTAVFSVVNAVVLTPLRVAGAERLVRSVTVNNGVPQPISDASTYKVWRDDRESFEDVSAYRLDFVNLTADREPEQVPVARVSEGFFRLFRASLAGGRTFSVDEDRPGGPAVAVLSYGLWTRRYAADPAAIGRTISLGSVPHVIVGVTARDFDSEQFEPSPDVFVPLQADPERVDGASIFQISARLRPGVTLPSANARLGVAYDAFAARSRPESIRRAGRAAWTAQPLRDAMVGSVRPSFNLLLGAVGLLLLIACANIANVLLVRADVRKRELAIRAAIGAGRWRIVRQLLIESLVLSLAGGAVGLLAGPIAMRALLTLYPGNNPFLLGGSSGIPRLVDAASQVAVDGRVLLFTLTVSVVAGIIFGLLPSLHVGRADLNAILLRSNSASSGGRRLSGRALVVAAEVALAVVLVVGAALLVRTSLALRTVEPGFDPDGVLTMRMSVTGTRFETRDGITELARGGIAQLQTIPGVARASTTCCMPLETVWQLPFVMASRAGQGLTTAGAMSFHGFAGWTFVSPGYFDVFNVPIVRGRDFSDADDANAPGVAIINEAMARRFWPDGDPLNDRLIVGRGMRPAYDADPVRQIIGVVGNVRDTGLTSNPRPAIYVPMAQLPDGVTVANVRLLPLVWIARTTVEPMSLRQAMEKGLQTASGGLPVARVRRMSDVVSESTARTRFDTWLMTAFGACALLLAAIGIYGLAAYWVQQRTKEIGIRVALGAESSRIARMVVWQGMRLAFAGLVVGTIAALGLARLMTAFVFGVPPHDPVVFVSIPLLLGLVALVAAWIPARRASRIDPRHTLRAE